MNVSVHEGKILIEYGPTTPGAINHYLTGELRKRTGHGWLFDRGNGSENVILVCPAVGVEYHHPKGHQGLILFDEVIDGAFSAFLLTTTTPQAQCWEHLIADGYKVTP
jgi:hypothetical protein